MEKGAPTIGHQFVNHNEIGVESRGLRFSFWFNGPTHLWVAYHHNPLQIIGTSVSGFGVCQLRRRLSDDFKGHLENGHSNLIIKTPSARLESDL